MKKLSLILLTVILFSVGYAQEKTIQLLPAEKDKGKNIMQALAERKSTRQYDSQTLNKQDLSNLLWAAFGVNRTDGKRTAPTAMNKQEITIYAVMSDGTYKYDAEKHLLVLIKSGDHRAAVASSQDYVRTAPVCLVIVADTNKFDGDGKLMAWVDAGIVSQNINLFCSGMGFATVPRGSMDKDKLREVLDLKDGEEPILNNPVGYPKK